MLKLCRHCKRKYPRPDGLPDYQWNQSRYCSPECRHTASNARWKKQQRDRLAGITPYSAKEMQEPSAKTVAEIEQRKAECRAKHFQGLVFAGED